MTTRRPAPGVVIAVLVAISLGCLAATVVGLGRDLAPDVVRASDPPPDVSRAESPEAHPRPEVEAAEVLAAWDADRAAAWATGDVRRLRSLYTSGSIAGQRDVALLRRWLDRGLVVSELRMQVLSLDELSRTADSWVLAVTDRLVGGEAKGSIADDTALPADTASAHTVTLRLVGDRWLVASVRALRTSRQPR